MTIYQTRLRNLEDKTVSFSVGIVESCAKYAKDPAKAPMVNQLIRSATSIGANYHEANNASSKTDFRNKIFLAKKEAAETRYWLRVLSDITGDEELTNFQQEALELNLIFQKIISTMKNGK